MSLSLSVQVSNGTETPIELDNVAAGMKVITVAPGERGMVLSEATSPVMDGSVVTAAVVDRQTSTIQVRVFGEPDDVLNQLTDLERLFQQFSYTVTVTINGVVEVWRCAPASTMRGQQGTLEANKLSGGWQDLVIEIPRQPTVL